MDHATIIAYAAGYIAVIFGAFLLYLPILIGFGLLLLLVGTVKLVILLLKVVTVGLYRSLVRLFRTSTGGLHRGPGGEGLVPR
ncbi:hypothetical protein QFZ79_001639 [Arthrobacter sp. V4I6]|uniref:hypothetical protein n=1 Tax=unclassified Arthrobacter TaxID=235627 RepID=UPI00278B39EA|nr:MULTISPECIES: hypothetical protein [unclassified Arthrobacter]MDQ0819344.1 hypothetical protein [Arthrobacter sp. V1I7]MDQ0853528.1 hypothetical protein [Arthrobacter sp. V4I6]